MRCDGESEAFLEFISDERLNILNDGQVTKISTNGQRESALDLGLVSDKLQPCSEFNVIDYCFGNDHLPITVIVTFRRQSAIKEQLKKGFC